MICFHGTNRKNAESILQEGFRVGTWFAIEKENAIKFGGPYVFAVKLDRNLLGPGVSWQFHTLIPIPASAIVSCHEIAGRN
jgi:hypothetical protein